MESSNDITGIVLAGGKSSRMGYDKGLAIVEGKKMIERVILSLKNVVDQVIIIANTDTYDYLNLPVFKDVYPDKGPVGGIYTGLLNSSADKNLIVACDMPFLTESLLKSVVDSSADYQVVVPSVNGRLEPLCGFYRKDVADTLKQNIEADELPVHKAIRKLNYLGLVQDIEKEQRVFANINKPEDII